MRTAALEIVANCLDFDFGDLVGELVGFGGRLDLRLVKSVARRDECVGDYTIGSGPRARRSFWPPLGGNVEGDRSMREASKVRFGRWILALIIFQAPPVGASARSQDSAVSGIVTGNDQHVGFRAMVMKQAIEYNLAGSTKNDPNDIVEFTLQGDPKRIDSALQAIAKGTKKSSDIKVKTSPAKVDPQLDAFTIINWTSTSRNITTPYTLVFHLRSKDEAISPSDAKDEWREILKTTLKGDDLKKLNANE